MQRRPRRFHSPHRVASCASTHRCPSGSSTSHLPSEPSPGRIRRSGSSWCWTTGFSIWPREGSTWPSASGPCPIQPSSRSTSVRAATSSSLIPTISPAPAPRLLQPTWRGTRRSSTPSAPAGPRWTLTRGKRSETVRVSGPLQANNSLALRIAVLQGLGLARIPLFAVGEDLAHGRLVQVLPGWELGAQDVHALTTSRSLYRGRRGPSSTSSAAGSPPRPTGSVDCRRRSRIGPSSQTASPASIQGSADHHDDEGAGLGPPAVSLDSRFRCRATAPPAARRHADGRNVRPP